MQHILCMCNTPYQLMILINMKRTVLENDAVDLIISSDISNCEVLIRRIQNENIYNHVIKLDSKIYLRNFKKNGFLRRIKGKKQIREITHSLNLFYNKIYFANIVLEIKFLKKIYKSAELIMFEDGFASYSDYYGDFFSRINSKPNNLKDLILRYDYSVFTSISEMKVFFPSVFTWMPSFKLSSMSIIKKNDLALIEIYDNIFNFSLECNEYDKTIIYFEESYFADGIETNDIEIVKFLAQIFGKDNILVKIHPRSPVDRFKDLGYHTNTNTQMPWEVAALNLDLSDKTLISIASVAVIQPKILFKSSYKGVMLFDYIKNREFLKMSIIDVYRELSDEIGIHHPKTRNELLKLFAEV